MRYPVGVTGEGSSGEGIDSGVGFILALNLFNVVKRGDNNLGMKGLVRFGIQTAVSD